MYLINDQESYSLDIASGLPASAHTIPFLRGGNYQVSIGHSSHVWSDIPSQFHNSVKKGRE